MRVLLLAALVACGYPRLPAEPRDILDTLTATVRIESACADEELGDYLEGYNWTGTGVILDARHVLTAAHVVECPVIPVARVTLLNGVSTRMVVERDDAMFGSGRDLAMLVALADEDLGSYAPPVIGHRYEEDWYDLCAATVHGHVCGESDVYASDVVMLAPTRTGDSGAGVYEPATGNLIGIVIAGSKHYTKIELVDSSWLP